MMDAATLILAIAGLVLLVAVVNAVKSAERGDHGAAGAGERADMQGREETAIPISAVSAGHVPAPLRREQLARLDHAERRPQPRPASQAAAIGARVTTVQYTEIIVFRQRR